MTNSPTRGKGAGIAFLRSNIAYDGDGCLQWPLFCDDHGYGIVGYNGEQLKAARVMCELVKGQPPTLDHECAHSCGRGHLGCVDGRHLSWKTRAENQQDRRLHGTHGKPGVPGRNRLSTAQIAEIKSIGRTMTQRAIAAKFNCHPTNISKILNGARWKQTPIWLKHEFTPAELAAIKVDARTNADIAAEFGVGPAVISRIKNGRSYRHIESTK